MEATVLLCDAAQSVNGKLYILGGGWSITGPRPTPSALAIKLDVPWTDANRPILVKAQLVDPDGQLVLLPAPDGTSKSVEIEMQVEVGRPPGLLPGTTLDSTVAISLPPLPLPTGSRFVWQVEIDGESKPHWQIAFTTRPAAPSS